VARGARQLLATRFDPAARAQDYRDLILRELS